MRKKVYVGPDITDYNAKHYHHHQHHHYHQQQQQHYV